MKKKICYFLTLIVLSISLVFSVSTTSYAYTEEEKQMAKDWLAAHGYPPTMDGAYQAYQDYLNGKFDEELGVDVNGDGIPSTEETTEATTEITTQTTTENFDVENDSELLEKQFSKLEDDSEESQVVDRGGGNTDIASGSLEEAEIAQDIYVGAIVYPKSENDKSGMGTVILYQEREEDTYKKAYCVLLISTILMLAIHKLTQFKR